MDAAVKHPIDYNERMELPARECAQRRAHVRGAEGTWVLLPLR
jgi:hypothetical protein